MIKAENIKWKDSPSGIIYGSIGKYKELVKIFKSGNVRGVEIAGYYEERSDSDSQAKDRAVKMLNAMFDSLSRSNP